MYLLDLECLNVCVAELNSELLLVTDMQRCVFHLCLTDVCSVHAGVKYSLLLCVCVCVFVVMLQHVSTHKTPPSLICLLLIVPCLCLVAFTS